MVCLNFSAQYCLDFIAFIVYINLRCTCVFASSNSKVQSLNQTVDSIRLAVLRAVAEETVTYQFCDSSRQDICDVDPT